MSFNTANQTFRQLFGNGLTYRVPPFQRDYSWTEDEWDDLWQDMVALFEEDGDPAHYMGYLVLQSSDSKNFDIIDGQQRLTTISVMILAALRYFQSLVQANLDSDRNSNRKEQFQNSYIGYTDPVTLTSRTKLKLNRHNDTFYQTYLVSLDRIPQRGLNSSEHLLRKAFLWFQVTMQERFGNEEGSGQDLASFLDRLVDKLFFTVITVTDELNAFKVFETLNARGVRLSATDLLKNYLFSLISPGDIHELEVRSLEDRWERIVGLLGSERFPEFLRVFWNSRSRLVRKADLFKTIRRQISNRGEAMDMLRELDDSAETYAALRDPQDRRWNEEEREALEQLIMYGVRQPLALLMACYDAFYEDGRGAFTRILKAVAVISFRYNVICSLPAREQERLYNRVAVEVSSGEARPRQVMQELREVYPADDVFKVSFAEKSFRTTSSRNKKVVRYILFRIERQCYDQAFDFEDSLYNLEHILPEHPSDAWSDMDEAIQERCIYRIGNMTPLKSSRNSDIGNGGYEAKRKAYQESDFGITSAVAEHYETWNERAIHTRQSQLAQVAAGIWKVDFGDV